MRTLVLLLIASTFVLAQDEPQAIRAVQPTTTPQHGVAMNEFGLWTEYSPTSFQGIGISRERSFSKVAVRYGRRMFTHRIVAMKYTLDLVPLAVLRQPVNSGWYDDFRHRETLYAAGLSPVGFQWNFLPRRRIQPIQSWTGGFLYFNRPAPFDNGTRFNYTFDAGVGVEMRAHERRAVTVMWKYNHISNAYQVPANPGIDSFSASIGFSLFR